ncbi:NIF3-like protein 1 [Phlebotomus argentipes]|uniref:NIF3-like protein 1 n=1 Tax=Phlebotomus argentipes TaxID=94469 RepID=UPI002892ECBC|nr:NIF3-like protein 1 [Phlebotomus argentipes]
MLRILRSGQKWIVAHQVRKMSSQNLPTLPQVLEKLREFAPESLAESWDNVGLLIEPATPKSISGILMTNDLTEEVLREAVNGKVDLIISYHPPIFESLKRITQSSWKQRIVAKCLEQGIAVYSPHTAWDSVRGGVNDWLGEFLEKEYGKGQPIVPNQDVPDCGAGRIYQCAGQSGLTLADIISGLKRHISTPDQHVPVALVHPLAHKVKSVALCAGSGWSVLKGLKAELFITGEMSHHFVLDANHSGSSVILTNHSNSERNFLPTFKKHLEKSLPEVTVTVSVTDRDPLTLDTL